LPSLKHCSIGQYLASKKAYVLKVQYISQYLNSKDKIKKEAKELAKRIILLHPKIRNIYGGIIMEAVGEKPQGVFYLYKSYPVFQYIGDLNELVDFSVLNVRFTRDYAGFEEVEPTFDKNEMFYIHYSVIGFATDNDGNVHVIKKIGILDPGGERVQVMKDLGEIYGKNTKVITSYDQLRVDSKIK